MTAPLTPADLEVLEFERVRFTQTGPKDTAIRERFGIRATHYYQRLGRVLAHPDALVYDAQLVRRLQRLAEARRSNRRRTA